MVLNWLHRLHYARSEWHHTAGTEWRQELCEWFEYTFPEWLKLPIQEWMDGEAYPRRVNRLTAALMPDLGTPRMSPGARKALKAVFRYEEPMSDGSVTDILQLAEARGFAVHPCDWVPQPTDTRYPALYRPWAEWLADKGYTAFGEGVRLTRENTLRFRHRDRISAFKRLYSKDRNAAYDFLISSAEIHDEEVRYDLLSEIGGGNLFSGSYPSDVPTLRYFLNDNSPDVRNYARDRLIAIEGKETAEMVAKHIARYLEVKEDSAIVPVQPDFADACLFSDVLRITVEDVAAVFDMQATEFVRRLDIGLVKSDFSYIITKTGSVEVRTIVVERLIEAGYEVGQAYYKDLPRHLWEHGLRSTFQSHYTSSVNNFLGPEMGTLDATMMRDLRVYQNMKRSVLCELETGELPVNEHHDELRILGLALNKSAAGQVLQEAIGLGMAEENPRLTMLHYNLQL